MRHILEKNEFGIFLIPKQKFFLGTLPFRRKIMSETPSKSLEDEKTAAAAITEAFFAALQQLPPNEQPRFKAQNTYETRKEVAGKIREQYPDRYPVIVEIDPKAANTLIITKKKFLAPGDIPLNKFMLEVRKVIRMGRQDPLAVMVENGHMVSGDSTIGYLYNQFKDPDGFLYILFSGDV